TLKGNVATMYMTSEDNLGNLEFIKAGEVNNFYLDPIDVISGGTATLGRNVNTTLHTFKGSMDEIKFYNHALTQTELNSEMNAVVSKKFVKIDTDSYLTAVGQQKQLQAKVYEYPVLKSQGVITWSSSDDSIATVDVSNGIVTGVTPGAVTISAASLEDTDSVQFTVVANSVSPSAITITPATAVMYDMATMQLTATIAPTGATQSDVVWTIESGSDIVSIDQDGLLTAIAQVTSPAAITIKAVVAGTQVSATKVITVNPSLVAYHSFDGNLLDSSYKNSAIKAVYGTQSYEAGIKGQALKESPADKNSADGGGYIRLADNVLISSTQFTISVWMNAEQLTAWTPLIYVSPRNGGEPFMTIQPSTPDNGKPAFHICSGPHYFTEASQPLQTGTWYHMVATYDNGVASLYIDGELAAYKRGMPASPFGRTANEIWIGANRWDTVYNGLLDELQIYGAALSPDKVKELYESYDID
ncbi:MAG: LamG-like jellyroll fold domain-containing protein, partial [Ruminiclostridium sp.]